MPAPLSLTNPVHITQLDIQTLANYNPASGLIAIQYRQGTAKIINLPREEITCLQVFLSYLSIGDLANKQFTLYKVLKHLDQFNWSYACEQNKDSDLYKAYNTLRLLGTKCYGCDYKWVPSDVTEAAKKISDKKS